MLSMCRPTFLGLGTLTPAPDGSARNDIAKAHVVVLMDLRPTQVEPIVGSFIRGSMNGRP